MPSGGIDQHLNFYTFTKCFCGVQYYHHLISNHIHCFPRTGSVTVAVQVSFPHKHLHLQSLTVHPSPPSACLVPPLSLSLSMCLLCWLAYHQHVLWILQKNATFGGFFLLHCLQKHSLQFFFFFVPSSYCLLHCVGLAPIISSSLYIDNTVLF